MTNCTTKNTAGSDDNVYPFPQPRCHSDSFDFEIGDVVTLVSGGPDMTVAYVCEDCGEVGVDWFDLSEKRGWQFYRDVFPGASLIEVE